MTIATAARALDPDAPWTWSMRDVLGLLNQRQRRYVEVAQRTFLVKRADGHVVPYDMQPYQAWFHAHSSLALGQDAPNRIVPKGRGVGLTIMDAMDNLLHAHTRPRIKIPVAGRQAETGDEMIEKTWDLIRDSVVEVDGRLEPFFDADPNVTSLVRLGNGSSIIPVAGGNPNAFRGKRAPKASLDEYAFHPHPTETWRAVRAVLSEGGQLTVLSTHDGADTHFHELVEAVKSGKLRRWMVFEFPIHSRDFDDARPISDQVREGTLRLIAPWLDVRVLDDFLAEDPLGYKQENLAEVMDEEKNLISRAVAEAAHDDALEAWERPVTLDDLRYLKGDAKQEAKLLEVLLRARATVPVRPAGNLNPVNVAIDFASTGDLSAWTAVEETPEGAVQRYLHVLRGIDTPAQNALLRIIEGTLRPNAVGIDMTGPGTGLYEHARHDLRCAVHGINFGGRVEAAPGAGREDTKKDQPKVPIKKAMALNLDHVLRTRQLRLLGKHPLAPLQKKHLRAIRREDLDAPRRAGEGHADIFWADAMCAYVSRLSAPLAFGSVSRR